MEKYSGRVLALDYGDSRIGVAVSDPNQIICTPLPFVKNDSNSMVLIQAILTEYEPTVIFIGDPINLDGSDSASQVKVDNFIAGLIEFGIKVPIIKIDERRSTKAATQFLQASGNNSMTSKGKVDSAAAAMILEMGISRFGSNEK